MHPVTFSEILENVFNIAVLVVFFITTSFVMRYGKRGTKIKRYYTFCALFLLLVLWRI